MSTYYYLIREDTMEKCWLGSSHRGVFNYCQNDEENNWLCDNAGGNLKLVTEHYEDLYKYKDAC